MSTQTHLAEAAKAVQKKSPMKPTIGVVLGSGLGDWAEGLTDRTVLRYDEIPHMPSSAIVGHKGNLVLGASDGVPLACLQGRVHVYEGHPMDRVVFGVRLLVELGCHFVLLTNAAGGLRPDLPPGTLMLITDHLNLMGQNPLVGPNEESLGTRFPDMSRAYDPQLRDLAMEAAHETKITLAEGVYAAMLGPSYETPAEIAMLRSLGADAVGMSTVPEVIALRHRKARVAAISCITNLAAGLSPTELDHKEVEETAKRTRKSFGTLLTKLIGKVAQIG